MRIHFRLKGSIIYLIILTACIVFASFYGGLLPFILLYGTLLFVPVSFIYLMLNYHFLSVFQELDTHRVTKGELHDLTVTIENIALIPIHEMQLYLHSDRCTFEGIKEGERISLKPKGKLQLACRTSCIYGGTYNIGISHVGFADVFGIFLIVFNVPYSFRAIVSPRITDAANAYLDIENNTNSIGSKSEIKTEDIPGNEMRAYIPGDPLSSINWKVSARLSSLTVRIPDKLDTRTIVLVLEASDDSGRSQDIEFLKRRDYFLEFSVSAVWYFARRGIPVQVVYPAGKITERQIDSYEGFSQFYRDLSGGISYRSEDEKDRMHKLTEERKRTGYANETRVIVLEDEWPGEGFCIVAG